MPTVLIADDDPAMLDLISTILRDSGIDSRTALDGEEAVRVAQEALPDCVMLDILMPGLSGLAVCSELRSGLDTAAIPVIILTALGRPRDVSSGYASGADDYLVKPFHPDDLLARVAVQLSPVRQSRYRRS
jgi:DNA-binding response OmpR family regulator